MLFLLAACIDLVPDLDELGVLPSQEPTNLRIETQGTTWYFTNDGPAVLTRYVEDAEVLALNGNGDLASFQIIVASPEPLTEGDPFPLGGWGPTSAESNGIAVAGLAGVEPIALGTEHPDGTYATGTITIAALSEDRVSVTFDGELIRGEDDEEDPSTQRVQGWFDDVELVREVVETPAP